MSHENLDPPNGQDNANSDNENPVGDNYEDYVAGTGLAYVDLIDPDLNSMSCIGINVKFPDLWEVVKRYILRGDEFYQHGGLSILNSQASRLPLNEAVDILEAYFEKWNHRPDPGPRGGVSLPFLSACHAVATSDPWDSSDIGERKIRILSLLKKYQTAIRKADSYDDPVVTETIEAIRNDKYGFVPTYPSHQNYVRAEDTQPVNPSTPDSPSMISQSLDKNAVGQIDKPPIDTSSSVPTKSEVGITGIPDSQVASNHSTHLNMGSQAAESAISPSPAVPKNIDTRASPSIVANNETFLLPGSIQMDIIKVSHGYEMLTERLIWMEKTYTKQIEDMQRSIDRFMSGNQEKVGRTQVTEQRRANVIAVIAIVIALLALFLTANPHFVESLFK